MPAKLLITTTGAAAEYLPSDGLARDELLGLVRLALPMRAQHAGKRPGLLARTVLECCRRMGPPYSFSRLLEQLDVLAAERAECDGSTLPPVEAVRRTWELVIFHDPNRGRVEVPFATLRGHLTSAKKTLVAGILDYA